MFKKPVSIIAALALSISLAGSAFAAFGNLSLIRVVSDSTPGSTVEVATDLGNISSLIGASNLTIGGGADAFTNFTEPSHNLSVNYYAWQTAATTKGTLYIASNNSTTPSAAGSTLTKGKLNTIQAFYNGLSNANSGATTVVTSNTTTGSFGQQMGMTALGGYGGYTASIASNTNLSLASLATAPIAMALWKFADNSNMNVLVTGTEVLNLTTNADGSTTINPPAAAKSDQTISAITFNPVTLDVGGTTSASALASSGLPVTFSSTTPAVCTVSGSIVTGVSAGNCTIAANQAGGTSFNAALQVTQDITAVASGKTNQTITFANPGAQTFGTTPTLTATVSSGLLPAFTSSTPSVCTITTDGILTFITAGDCTIAADQAGDATFNPALQITQTFTVNKAAQIIQSFSFTPNSINIGGTTTASATATSGLAVTFSSTTPAVCTVIGSIVTSISGGTCTIAADQAGNAGYNAASQVTHSITPGLAGQTIGTIFFNPATLALGGTTTASATATSGLAVTFSSATPAVCSVSGSTVTSIGAGTCTIAADQAGNVSFNAASQVTQNISTTNVPPGAPTGVIATSGNSLATVSFTAPAFTGGSAITGYTVTSTPGGLTGIGAASPITVTGLTNGTPYTFTVNAMNAIGTGAASQPSSSVTPATVPNAPTGVAATAGNAEATVSFIAPASTGGSAITGYTVTSTPGGLTSSGAASPIAVTGLTNGTSYNFTVTATNASGTGSASTPSNFITPVFPPTTFTVTPKVTLDAKGNANGKIEPARNQTVVASATTSFVVTPDTGYQISTVTGCGGTLSGANYTTAGIIRDCSVSAVFIAKPAHKGDLNGDGKIDVADAMLALQFAVGFKKSPADIAAGDVAPIVNGKSSPDGKIDIADAVAILQYSVGTLKSW